MTPKPSKQDHQALATHNKLSKKIKSLDWKEVRKDVERFLKPEEQEALKIWDEDLFLDRVKKIVL